MEGPYAFGDNTWVGYDTIKTTEKKSQYVLHNNLGGAMIWELSADDFNVSKKNMYWLPWQVFAISEVHMTDSFQIYLTSTLLKAFFS